MEPIDYELVSYETACKALWHLYRNGRWVELASLGMDRLGYHERLRRFDLLYLDDDTNLSAPSTIGRFSKHRPERHVQVKEFLRVIPNAYEICGNLLATYIKTGGNYDQAV